MTLANYQAAYTNTGLSAVYNHKLVYGDKGLQDLLGFAKTFVAQLPNFQCADLFPQALYYADASIWNPIYGQPADSILFGLLGFNLATKSEAMYYCIDTIRAPAIIKLLQNSGLPIPPEVGQIYAQINQIQQSFNFLNIQFRFEGMFVTTDAYAAYNTANPSAWVDTMVAQIPEYTRADLFEYKAGC